MALYFKTNRYTHEVGEVDLSPGREGVRSESGFVQYYRNTWTIRGKAHVDSQADIDDTIAALTLAYSGFLSEAGLYDESTNAPFFRVRAQETSGGIQVVSGPSFPSERGHLVNYVPYAIQLEYQTAMPVEVVSPWGQGILNFQETVTISGGGPKWALIETLTGPPIRQLVCQQSIIRMTQVGRILAQDTWAPPQTPIWESALHTDRSIVSRGSPESVGQSQRTRYPTSWSYEFSAGDEPSQNTPTNLGA